MGELAGTIAIDHSRSREQDGRIGAMGWKDRASGSVLGLIGFLLSPLSWWNDAFINLPLAVAFGWLVSLIYKPAFAASVVVGYWLTNVLGLILMHKGAVRLLSPTEQRYTWRQLRKDMLISLVYTGGIVLLIKLKVLRPVENYFPS